MFWVHRGLILAFGGHIWVRFFTILNNDGQSLASFFQKKIAGQMPEIRGQNPELGGADAIVMN
jgi:hypothetical protein